MSYDIYAYKSSHKDPSIEEAEALVNLEIPSNKGDNFLQEKIALALVESNPKLERFKFDYDKIARSLNTTVEKAKDQFNHIELNSAEGELPFQFIINKTDLTMSMPYWYDDKKKVAELFSEAKKYLQIIYGSVNYHVYDPQTKQVCLSDEFDVEKAKDTYLGALQRIGSQLKKPEIAPVRKNKISLRLVYVIVAILGFLYAIFSNK